MASETMESAIMMEVESIRRYVDEEMTEISRRSMHDHRQFIRQRLGSIETTLNEGDPT